MKTDARFTGITAAGAVLFINGLVIGMPMTIHGFTAGREVSFEETVADWRYVWFNIVYLVALIGLITVAPTLRTWVGRTGRRLPGWAVTTFIAVAALQACTIFTQAVVPPFLLEVAPEALVAEDGGAFAVTMTAIWIAWIIALVGLAICGIVTKTIPVTAAVLMIIGGVIIPAFGPIGSVLVGAAFAWAGWAQSRPARVAAEPQAIALG